MGKRLFLLIFAGVMGLVSSSELLTAADSYVASAPEFHAVETVLPPEPEPEPVAVKTYNAPATGYAPAAPQVVNYTITTYINSATDYANTASNLSYNSIYKFRKLVYGHNSANLLGNLSARYAGEVFTITEGGVAKNYQVVAIATYAKTADGNLENDPNLMRNIAYSALGHDVALMTCAGQSYGNGDASHRLVVYANAI